MGAGDLVLLADPQIAAVPVAECGQALRSIAGSGLALDARKRDRLGVYALVRDGVQARLAEAQARLPNGVRLLVVEAYRPVALQGRYFDEHVARLRLTQRPGGARPRRPRSGSGSSSSWKADGRG